MSGRQTGEQRDRSSAGGRPLLSMALLVVLMASLSGGCAWTARGSQAGEAEFREIRTEPEAAISQEELRLRLMRFTDAFYDALGPPMDPILDSPDLNLRRAALEMLYNYSAASIAIATGPFPATNLLDMVVFITLIHGSMEEYWVPRFGGHGKAAVEVVARYERDIWDLAAILLSDQQQEDLRGLIAEWQQRNPDQFFVEWTRFGDFANQLGDAGRERASGLLADVHAVTETAESALVLSERLMYIVQRAPVLWRAQGLLAYYDVIAQPEMQGALGDSARISASAERLSIAVERLSNILLEGPTPKQEETLLRLQDGEARVRRMIGDVRETLVVANALTTNVDTLAETFEIGAAGGKDKPPFDIQPYQETLAEASVVARELGEVLEGLTELLTSPTLQESLPQAVGQAQLGTREMLRYLVILSIVVIVASVMSAFFAFLGYRYLALRLERRMTEKTR